MILRARKTRILRRAESSRILAVQPGSKLAMSDTATLTPVREAHRFDEAALDRYLRAHVAGYSGGLEVRQFEGGQSNPTFALRSGDREFVLRKQPPGHLLPSAHQVDREYRVLKALAGTDVPVAKVFHLCEDRGLIGSMFYVMEFLDGRIFWDAAIPEVGRAERTDFGGHLAHTLLVAAAHHDLRLRRWPSAAHPFVRPCPRP